MSKQPDTSKEWEKNCPKCGGRCWRDEHPDGYMVGLWNCEDCSWFESNPNLPVQEDWGERFEKEFDNLYQYNSTSNLENRTYLVKSFIQQEIDRAVKEVFDLIGDPEIRFIEWRDYVDEFYADRKEVLILSYTQWLKEKFDEIREDIKNG